MKIWAIVQYGQNLMLWGGGLWCETEKVFYQIRKFDDTFPPEKKWTPIL